MTLVSPLSRYILLIFCVLSSIDVSAQTIVQWASRVEDYSSELSELQHSAKQITGKPNILPAGGDNPNAWSPFNNNTQEFIKVQFDLPMPIVQIAIGETYNPGSIKEVFTYDEDGNGYTGGTVYSEVNKNYPTTVGAYQRSFAAHGCLVTSRKYYSLW